MKAVLFILITFFFLFTAFPVSAIENPTAVANNKYGIHIVNENDLDRARELVNSSGGDWGYIKVVIQESERSQGRWQEVFNRMRRLHLIPIIRIATHPVAAGWAKPIDDEMDGWVDFLNSLNWVVKNRYVIIGNEPNQDHEWGGEANPEEYANYLSKLSSKLKSANSDFFILSPGFDASAPNGKTTMSETSFLERMIKHNPNVFDNVDGWSSHSYPDAKKLASNQYGRGSLRTYEWELNYLKEMGINREFPVFITETGWQHDKKGSFGKVDADYSFAAKKIWSDSRIVSVVPFLLNYADVPFLQFSWLDTAGQPYPFYYDYLDIPKQMGTPVQITAGAILGNLYFPVVQANHGIYGLSLVENTGQSIWKAGKYMLNPAKLITHLDIEPFQTKALFYKIQSPDRFVLFTPNLQLTVNGVAVGSASQMFVRVVKFVSIFQLLPRFW